MNNFQQTIKEECAISGHGLHSGMPVTLTIKPATTNHGVKFQRIDLPNQPIIDLKKKKKGIIMSLFK